MIYQFIDFALKYYSIIGIIIAVANLVMLVAMAKLPQLRSNSIKPMQDIILCVLVSITIGVCWPVYIMCFISIILQRYSRHLQA